MYDLTDKIKQVETLKNVNGMQALLNDASKILGNPIVMFNTDYQLIASTQDVVTDDPIWNELVANGTFSKETQEIFKEEGFIDAVANAKTITLLFTDKLKYNRISGKVFNKTGAHVANLVIVACGRPFDSEDAVVFESLCKMVSDKIHADRFYQDYEKMYQESLIRKLIEGNMDDKELYSAHMAILYNGLKDHLFLAVADIGPCESKYVRLMGLKDLLIQKQPAFKYSICCDHIVMILSSDQEALDVNRDLCKLNGLFRKKKMRVGISGRFENLFALPKYYDEAVSALQRGMASDGRQRVFLYESE